ncbi:MAG: TIGR03067 domain-containing protein [Verrucomicrobia bacterium]|nr:TIGR03067 domain-containing protein [Verrucomicrobiota bacterium]
MNLPLPLSHLNGRWEPQRAILSGSEIPREALPGLALELTDGAYRVGHDFGRVVLVEVGPPLAIDIIGEFGPNAGRTLHAISQLEGDTYRVCYELGDGPRPTEFASPRGAMRLLIEFQRG